MLGLHGKQFDYLLSHGKQVGDVRVTLQNVQIRVGYKANKSSMLDLHGSNLTLFGVIWQQSQLFGGWRLGTDNVDKERARAMGMWAED